MDKTARNSPDEQNPLGTQPIPRLLRRYAVPSIVSMLVMSLYNIVDQIFIGWGVGYLGNGATTVAFPLVTVMLALSLLVGNGAAAFISLELGRGNSDNARRVVGNAAALLFIASLVIMGVVFLFREPILTGLGAKENVLPYARDYVSIIALGAPFAMLGTGLSNIIRADGAPRYCMLVTLLGAGLNTLLDPLFIFVFGLGVAGAAWATILSQAVGMAGVFYYLLRKAKYVRLRPKYLRPSPWVIRRMAALGSSSFVTQIAIAIFNVVMNNVVTHYGALSEYGSDIPLAAVGIVMKINAIMIGLILGISIGAQPILGYNYGAGKLARVKKTLFTELACTLAVSTLGCILFTSIPGVFVAIFGDSSEQFNDFAARFMRIFLCCVFTAGAQIPSAGYFQAVGKPMKAMALSMTRQLLILMPLVIILPMFWGLNGVMYAGPVADVTAFAITTCFIAYELRRHLTARPEAVQS